MAHDSDPFLCSVPYPAGGRVGVVAGGGAMSDELGKLWDEMSMYPDFAIISVSSYAEMAAMIYMEGRLDVFGIRRWLVERKIRRDAERAMRIFDETFEP
jgi:hypothetical protein